MALKITPIVGRSYRRNGVSGMSDSRLNASITQWVRITVVTNRAIYGRVSEGILKGSSVTIRHDEFTTAHFDPLPK